MSDYTDSSQWPKTNNLESQRIDSVEKPFWDGKNRKQRRMEKAWARKQSKKQTLSVYHWCNRIVREMKDNKDVQQKIIDGKFDYFLEKKEN